MAEYIAITPQLSIAGVDLTDWVRSAVTVESTADEIDTSSAASRDRTYAAGMNTRRFRVTLKQSYEAGGPNATITDALLGTSVAVTTKPTEDATSATNPQQAFNAIVLSTPTATGRIGELSEFNIDWPITGSITQTP